MDSRDGMGRSDAPLRKFHWNFVVDEEEEWRACFDYLLELFREDLKRKREMEEEEVEEKKKKEKKPRLFFRRWSAPLAPVLSAVPAVVAPATTFIKSLVAKTLLHGPSTLKVQALRISPGNSSKATN
ncbi:hypothetical protein FOVSG1_004731 [Fusarium oxysporum f. sp. vasinfectum]